MRCRRSCGRSRPVRLLEILVHGHDGGHRLPATRHDPLVFPGVRHHVSARVDAADRGGHVRLDPDQPVPFELDAPPRQGRDLRFETDVHDHRIDVEDRLLQRSVVVYDRPLDLPVAFEARDLGVEEDLDRALHHRLDVLLHRPELFATMDEDDLLRGRHDLEGDLERAVSPPTTTTRFPLNSRRSRTRYSTPFDSNSASPGTPSRFGSRSPIPIARMMDRPSYALPWRVASLKPDAWRCTSTTSSGRISAPLSREWSTKS